MTGLRLTRKVVFIALIIVAAIAVVAVVSTRERAGVSAEKVQYYCPMHPGFVSDKPGDCPICFMKLVKRGADGKGAQRPEDVCYLHNCPMVHQGVTCPMMVVAKAGEEVTCPVCGTHVVEKQDLGKAKILYWTDPMLPGFKSDKPGKSPMGMEMVPVYEESMPAQGASSSVPEGYAPILVTPRKQQLIGVRTALVERRALTKTIRTVGTVAHDPELYQAQAEYVEALKALKLASEGTSQEALAQAQRLAEAARIHLRHLGLSDVLIEELAARGEVEHSLLFAHPGEPVWVYAQVYEYELPLVRVGQEIAAESSALPGEIFRGTVRAIDPMVEQVTRSTRVRAQLKDTQGLLKPDMYLNISIQVDLGEVLALPEGAVFETGLKTIVFVDKGRGLFEPRDVTVGAQADGFYELKAGVEEGEAVVTSGNFLIDSESRLKAALEGMTSSGGTAGPSGHEHAH